MFSMETSLSKSLSSELVAQGCTGLLMDAVTLLNLPHQLAQWTNPWIFEPLYTAPHMAGLESVSPRILKITDIQNPVLQDFLAHSHEEWGYLLLCDGTWQTLVQHMRWLTVARMPHGQDVFLKVADPAVMHAVLNNRACEQDATLFGPCRQILMADGIQGRWHAHNRPGSAPEPSHQTPYLLNAAQALAFDDVKFRGVVKDLDTHMRHYFSGYQGAATPAQRWVHLQGLATQAYERGFNSELDIIRYANIHGYLGEEALQIHLDLERILSTASPQTPSQRVEKAAHIARCRALSLREPE